MDISGNCNSAADLIKRVLPEDFSLFDVRVKESSKEYFRVTNSDNRIILEASNPVGIASALNWYLREKCNSYVSKYVPRISVPEEPEKIEGEKYSEAIFKYRYYMNYCTISYSMPWWNWEQWEKEIDWMAMNGINLPLAIIGQEAVWQNVLRRLNMPEDEIFKFLPGPAYLAWGWLGNIDGWGGPTTQNWIDDQKELQHKILARYNELEITPVLQAFTGRVPEYFKKLFPEAKIEQLDSWFGYEGVFFIHPSDPLFEEISRLFYEEQTKLYGNEHFYAGDIFHEIESPLQDKNYLNSIYKGIQDALLAYDKDAVWVQQSWSIRGDNIADLDKDHVLILDLYCETEQKWKTTNAFQGNPWAWCVITNFGGRTGNGARLEYIKDELALALKDEKRGKLVGIGLAPEGIGTNEVIYDLLTEANWNSVPGNLDSWLISYVNRRYGYKSEAIIKAWKILVDTVYSGPNTYPPLESIICAMPSFEITQASSNGSTELYYDNNKLIEALEFLMSEKNNLSNVDSYVHDVVDLTRQVGANIANIIYNKLIEVYKNNNIPLFKKFSDILLNLISDLDQVLDSHEPYTLYKWISSAKEKAQNTHEQKLFEWNARRQITLWSSPEITEFHDYGNKQWSGLLSTYYLKRWEAFTMRVIEAMETGSSFDYDKYKSEMLDFGVEWSERTDLEKPDNSVDAVCVSLEFFNKYKSIFDKQ